MRLSLRGLFQGGRSRPASRRQPPQQHQQADEIGFLVDQERRIELNAMSSDVFIAWLEDRLTEHGAGKVVPDHTVLAEMWRRAIARQHVAKDLRKAEIKAMAAAIYADVPP